MAESKSYKKRLTDAGGAVCVLTFISLLLSIAGTVIEFVGTEIYNEYYTAFSQNILADGVYSFVKLYEKSFILTALDLVLFISAMSARKKKKLGWEFPALSVILSVVLAVRPVMDITELVLNGEFSKVWKNGSQGEIFQAVTELLISVLPVFACFFLLLAGLTAMGRFIGEDFRASVPVTKRMAVMPETSSESTAKTEQKKETYDVPYVSSQPEDAYRRGDNAEPVIAPMQESENEQPVPEGRSEQNNAPTEEKTQTENKAVCKYCGAEIPDGAKFCTVCGGNVEDGTAK